MSQTEVNDVWSLLSKVMQHFLSVGRKRCCRICREKQSEEGIKAIPRVIGHKNNLATFQLLKQGLCFWVNEEDVTLTMMTVSARILSVMLLDS